MQYFLSKVEQLTLAITCTNFLLYCLDFRCIFNFLNRRWSKVEQGGADVFAPALLNEIKELVGAGGADVFLSEINDLVGADLYSQNRLPPYRAWIDRPSGDDSDSIRASTQSPRLCQNRHTLTPGPWPCRIRS